MSGHEYATDGVKGARLAVTPTSTPRRLVTGRSPDYFSAKALAVFGRFC